MADKASDNFNLLGGTTLYLQIGHRKSFDRTEQNSITRLFTYVLTLVKKILFIQIAIPYHYLTTFARNKF
jgi:hypothetical protein